MTTPPCAGLWRLFDSTDLVDHRQAAKMCATCPLIESCRDGLASAREVQHSPNYGPAGTWAGELVGPPAVVRGSIEQGRRDAEEALYTLAEARSCAVRWQNGEHNDYTKTGRRVYERLIRRARLARQADAA